MDLSLILAAVGGVIAGLVVALKVIAPLTKNKVDDKVLEVAEKAEDVLDTLKPKK